MCVATSICVVGQQRFLAELLSQAEEASAEVGGKRRVLRQKRCESQEARRIPQAAEVLGVLGQPRAKNGAHGSAGEGKKKYIQYMAY